MSIIGRIRVVSDEMAALHREGQTEELQSALKALKSAARQVGQAWSGSWLGYQANVYYQGLVGVPPNARFSQEFGLFDTVITDTVGSWVRCTSEEIEAEVTKLAGSPDLDAIFRTARSAAERALDGRADLLAQFAGLARCGELDQGLIDMRKEVEAVRMLDEDEILNRWHQRGRIISRDVEAINQGACAPGHLRVLARVAVVETPFTAAQELARVARNIARHVEALGMGREPMQDKTQPQHVFVGHGRSPAWRELKDYLKETLGLTADEFNRVSVAGISTSDRLKQMLDESAMAFLVMTAEDEAANGSMQARMNVVHEVGLFQGRLGFNRAIVLLEDGCAEFSNIVGLTQLRFPPGRISACFHDVRAVLVREGLVASP
ncbi:MAG: nucleotide-binding protein [Inhella sp.]